jgi:hypothetical protein
MFAAYTAVLILSGEATSGSKIWPYIHLPLRTVDALLERAFRIVVFRGDIFIRFLGDWAFMAAFILISLRLLHSIKAIRPFLFYMIGMVALAPLYTRNALTSPIAEPLDGWWLWAEGAAAVACATLFSSRRGPRLPAPVIPIVVSVHFGCWFLFQWRGNTWYLWQMSALLILPFCLALSWAFCTREQQGQVSQTSEAPTPK